MNHDEFGPCTSSEEDVSDDKDFKGCTGSDCCALVKKVLDIIEPAQPHELLHVGERKALEDLGSLRDYVPYLRRALTALIERCLYWLPSDEAIHLIFPPSSNDIAQHIMLAHRSGCLIEKLATWFDGANCPKVKQLIVVQLFPLFDSFSELRSVLPKLSWKQYQDAQILLRQEAESNEPLSCLFRKQLVHHRRGLTDAQIDSVILHFARHMKLDAARATYRGSRLAPLLLCFFFILLCVVPASSEWKRKMFVCRHLSRQTPRFTSSTCIWLLILPEERLLFLETLPSLMWLSPLRLFLSHHN
jgi:hypothetical protein